MQNKGVKPGVAAIIQKAASVFIFILFLNGSPPHDNGSSSTTTTSPSDITDERFAAVAAIMQKEGARAERDPKFTNTVRIYVASSISLTMTKEQAQELASMARSRLGDEAIVYVKSESGRTLGKASPLGVE